MESNAHTETYWKPGLQAVVAALLTFLFIWIMAPFLVTILLGAVLAVVAFPLYRRLCGKLACPLASAAVTFLVVIGILLPIFGALYGVASELLPIVSESSVASEAKSAMDGTGTGSSWMYSITEKVRAWIPIPINHEWLQRQGSSVLQSVAAKTAQVFGAFLASVPALILGFFIVVLCIYFFLVDGTTLLSYLRRISPWRSQRTEALFRSFEEACRGVILGFIASGFTQGLVIWGLFTLLGVPNAILLGALTVVLGMIPTLGGGTVAIGGAVYLFLNGKIAFGIIALVGTLFVSTIDNVVRAYIMKGQSRIHPLLALLAAFGGVAAMGAAGIFLGPIVAAVFVTFSTLIMRDIEKEKRTHLVTPTELELPTPQEA